MFGAEHDQEAAARRVEEEIAELCGVLNATTAALVDRIAHALDGGLWEGSGIRSPQHWVMLQCGVSPGRARSLVAMARRLGELPETKASFEAGALSEDQARLVVRHAPAINDGEVAELARQCTMPQLQRTLSAYTFVEPPAADAVRSEELRRVRFHFEEDGSWRLSARLPGDEGALWERALGVVRDDLFRARAADAEEVTWADAFVAVADRALSRKGNGRPRSDRYLTLLHVETDAAGAPHARVHLGPALPSALRRLLLCDGLVKPVHKVRGVAVSVGRRRRIVPNRTRVVVEDRDRGCRVPGCANRRWTEVHHIVHWEDGGATDTPNLVLLCGPHHRMHHRGGLGIAGDADDPNGLVFTDGTGRRMRAGPSPRPPGRTMRRLGRWRHPTGEHLDRKCIWFREPPAA